jgi:hypothetical protein
MTGSNTDNNPYRPPTAATHPKAMPNRATEQSVVLYSTGQVLVATFFGAFLAGAILMAMNYRRIGSTRATAAIVIGALASVALFLFSGFVLPESFPAIIVNVASLLVMRSVCTFYQGATLEAHFQQGGAKGSSWAAVGIGLACGVSFVVAVMVLVAAVGLVAG